VASQFKNRLVGVTILVACIVIFLPTIIDGKKTSYEDEFIATPIKPEIKEHTLVVSVPRIAQDESKLTETNEKVTVQEALVQETSATNNADWKIEEVAKTLTVSKQPQASAKKTHKKQFTDNAWTIQLGAFQNAANINALLKQLRIAGFQAHTVPTQVTDGVLTRVFVGPDVSEKRLKQQLPRLKKLTSLDGKILPFKATNP